MNASACSIPFAKIAIARSQNKCNLPCEYLHVPSAELIIQQCEQIIDLDGMFTFPEKEVSFAGAGFQASQCEQNVNGKKLLITAYNSHAWYGAKDIRHSLRHLWIFHRRRVLTTQGQCRSRTVVSALGALVEGVRTISHFVLRVREHRR